MSDYMVYQYVAQGDPKMREQRAARLSAREKLKETRKPCPGCGKDCRIHRRPADEVCGDCLLAIYRDEDATAVALAATTAAQEIVAFPHAPEGKRYSKWPRTLGLVAGQDLREAEPAIERFALAVNKAIAALLRRSQAAGKPRNAIDPFEFRMPPSSDETLYAIVPPGTADLLKEAEQAWMAMIPAIVAAGRQTGSSLLLQLAGGHITHDQFNDAAGRSDDD